MEGDRGVNLEEGNVVEPVCAGVSSEVSFFFVAILDWNFTVDPVRV